MQAQDNSSTTTKDQTTTTATTQSYDSSDWNAPRGYEVAYPESGSPNMVARQGYAAGFSQGQADAGRGKSFKPTESGAYEHAKIPKGMDKDQFKQQFRESFVKGYSHRDCPRPGKALFGKAPLPDRALYQPLSINGFADGWS